jgi:hypothetical protein
MSLRRLAAAVYLWEHPRSCWVSLSTLAAVDGKHHLYCHQSQEAGHREEGGGHGKEEGGQQVRLEGRVIVLTAESDLWQEVCCKEKGGVQSGGEMGAGTGGGLEMIVVWQVDC